MTRYYVTVAYWWRPGNRPEHEHIIVEANTQGEAMQIGEQTAHCQLGGRKDRYEAISACHIEEPQTPPADYPFCRRDPCPHWRGYCRKDPACND